MAKKLNVRALHRALAEARFLRESHAVDVRRLAPDEQPCPPKSAAEN
ncbi:MAG: hypothetical protein KGI29_07600 [Pseudomonadota bacterium]|nr:hypothetical protein [Pseudomonadota bacterium]MDE3037482.1 hypothetical protein [Pseudomonadota bacterium]